jgi:hypothetical protein
MDRRPVSYVRVSVAARKNICLIFLLWFFLLMNPLTAAPSDDGRRMPNRREPYCYLDNNGRLILNGFPFFPLGLFVIQALTDTRQLDEIAGSPFDTLMNYNINNGTDAKIAAYLDALSARNLKLIFSLKDCFGHGEKDLETITHRVRAFKDHPAVIGWYLNDELSPEHLTELEIRYRAIKELDRDHPVWSVHWNTNWLALEVHTTDVVGVDPYPIGNHPITLVSTMADAAVKAGKPLWLVPQIFDWRDYPGDFRAKTGRPPTRDEIRAMTYLAINHGAKGLIYYSYFNIRDDQNFPRTWIELKETAGEIDALRPAILSNDAMPDGDIACTKKGIDFRAIQHGRSQYLIAVNTESTNVSGVVFRMQPDRIPLEVTVLFGEGRNIRVDNSAFTDDFGPYEVHVYRWQRIS